MVVESWLRLSLLVSVSKDTAACVGVSKYEATMRITLVVVVQTAVLIDEHKHQRLGTN